MSEGPPWRSGALVQLLAVAGYWTTNLPLSPDHLGDAQARALHPGQQVALRQPLVLLRGSLHVYEEPVGRKPKRVGVLPTGAVLVPIGKYSTRPGIRFEATEGTLGLDLVLSDLLDLMLPGDATARALVEALAAAVEQQHWALRLSSQSGQMERLATLLLAVAEDRGVLQEEGVYLQGAPDVRELGVLAGVSRESALINLEWLVHTGVISRREGRLWVRDLDRLRGAAHGSPQES